MTVRFKTVTEARANVLHAVNLIAANKQQPRQEFYRIGDEALVMAFVRQPLAATDQSTHTCLEITTMKRILLSLAAVISAFLCGCAARPQDATAQNDWRAGTDYSPYRSIPVVLQCDDCRYEK